MEIRAQPNNSLVRAVDYSVDWPLEPTLGPAQAQRAPSLRCSAAPNQVLRKVKVLAQVFSAEPLGLNKRAVVPLAATPPRRARRIRVRLVQVCLVELPIPGPNKLVVASLAAIRPQRVRRTRVRRVATFSAEDQRKTNRRPVGASLAVRRKRSRTSPKAVAVSLAAGGILSPRRAVACSETRQVRAGRNLPRAVCLVPILPQTREHPERGERISLDNNQRRRAACLGTLGQAPLPHNPRLVFSGVRCSNLHLAVVCLGVRLQLNSSSSNLRRVEDYLGVLRLNSSPRRAVD